VKKPSIYFSPHLDKASLKAFNAIASHYQVLNAIIILDSIELFIISIFRQRLYLTLTTRLTSYTPAYQQILQKVGSFPSFHNL
jgi:hypothetical protein